MWWHQLIQLVCDGMVAGVVAPLPTSCPEIREGAGHGTVSNTLTQLPLFFLSF